jgi:basic membrane protein A
VKARVIERKAAIVAGEHDVFAGPVKNQKGEVMIAEGATASDEELLGMTWFVQGVVGSTE